MNDEEQQVTDILVDDEVVKREQMLSVARLAITLVAQVAMVFSWTIDVETWIAIAITAIDLYLICRHLWWKNNNMTKAAVAGQQVTNSFKEKEKHEPGSDQA